MFNLINKKTKFLKTIFGVIFLFSVFLQTDIVFAADSKDNKLDFHCGTDIIVCPLSGLAFDITIKISTFFLGLSGQGLNAVINYTILEAKEHMFPTETNSSSSKNKDGEKDSEGYINETWKIFRDIVNICLIFVIVYIGIMTIISGTEFGTQRLLVTVIAVAIFLNFSLLFTKMFIDLGNVAALNVYSVLSESTDGSISTSTKKTTSSEKKSEIGIAGYILSALHLQALVGGGMEQAGGSSPVQEMIQSKNWARILMYALYSFVIMMITALVLLVASLLLFVRYIMLIFLLIFSSLAFGSLVLPSLKKSGWDKWFSSLVGQVLLAPAFMLMLLVTTYVINATSKSFGDKKSNTNWYDVFDPAKVADAITGLLIPLAIIIAFLIGTIIFSKKLSDMGGGHAGTLTKFIGGAALGGAAFVTRRTAAITAGAIISPVGKRLRDVDLSRYGRGVDILAGGASRWIGRGAIKNADRLKNTTGDLRNAGFGISSLLKKTKVDLGEGSKKTYAGIIKEKENKANKDRERVFARTDDEKAELKEQDEARAKEEMREKEAREKNDITTERGELHQEEDAAVTNLINAEDELRDAIDNLGLVMADSTATPRQIESAKEAKVEALRKRDASKTDLSKAQEKISKWQEKTTKRNVDSIKIQRNEKEIRAVAPITQFVPFTTTSTATRNAISSANRKINQSDTDKTLAALKKLEDKIK